MDPTLLSTLISLGVSIVTVFLHKTLTAPAAPKSPNNTAPVIAPTPVPFDPFAGLPGLPGHPVLNVILPWLNGLVSGPVTSVKALAPADQAQNQAAMSALANLIGSDAETHRQMQALLTVAPATKNS